MSEQPTYKAGDAVLVYVGRSGGRGDEGWVQGVYRESPHPGHGVDLGDNRFIVINADSHIKPAPHVGYPGGADQYTADVATLTGAGALGDKATRGEWRWNFRHGTRYGDVATALESEASDGECFDIIELGGLPHMMVFSNADADLLVNAVNVARALSRFMPYALARLGGAS